MIRFEFKNDRWFYGPFSGFVIVRCGSRLLLPNYQCNWIEIVSRNQKNREIWTKQTVIIELGCTKAKIGFVREFIGWNSDWHSVALFSCSSPLLLWSVFINEIQSASMSRALLKDWNMSHQIRISLLHMIFLVLPSASRSIRDEIKCVHRITRSELFGAIEGKKWAHI